MYIQYIFLPIVGALIGWMTNYLAVKMLFRPINPVKIPLLPITIQGLLPRRRADIAENIALTVKNDLLPKDYLLEKILDSESQEKIFLFIKNKLNEKIERKLPAFLPLMVRKSIKEYIINFTEEELTENFDENLYNLQNQVLNKADFGQLVKSKIESFPMDKLENMVLNISSKELDHIKLLGGVLGFIIGIGQAAIISIFQI